LRNKLKRGKEKPGNERFFLKDSFDLCKLREKEGKLQPITNAIILLPLPYQNRVFPVLIYYHISNFCFSKTLIRVSVEN
jgi:hypothetical protein